MAVAQPYANMGYLWEGGTSGIGKSEHREIGTIGNAKNLTTKDTKEHKVIGGLSRPLLPHNG